MLDTESRLPNSSSSWRRRIRGDDSGCLLKTRSIFGRSVSVIIGWSTSDSCVACASVVSRGAIARNDLSAKRLSLPVRHSLLRTETFVQYLQVSPLALDADISSYQVLIGRVDTDLGSPCIRCCSSKRVFPQHSYSRSRHRDLTRRSSPAPWPDEMGFTVAHHNSMYPYKPVVFRYVLWQNHVILSGTMSLSQLVATVPLSLSSPELLRLNG